METPNTPTPFIPEPTSRLAAWWEGLLGRHGFHLSRRARLAVAATLLVALVLLAGLVVHQVHALAALDLDARDPRFEAIMSARVIAARGFTALGLKGQTLVETYLAFTVLDRTPLGKRLWHWCDLDTDRSRSQKTLAAGLAFCALLVACATLNARILP